MCTRGPGAGRTARPRGARRYFARTFVRASISSKSRPWRDARLAQARADLEHRARQCSRDCGDGPRTAGNSTRLAEVRQQPVDRERDEAGRGQRDPEHAERPTGSGRFRGRLRGRAAASSWRSARRAERDREDAEENADAGSRSRRAEGRRSPSSASPRIATGIVAAPSRPKTTAATARPLPGVPCSAIDGHYCFL